MGPEEVTKAGSFYSFKQKQNKNESVKNQQDKGTQAWVPFSEETKPSLFAQPSGP